MIILFLPWQNKSQKIIKKIKPNERMINCFSVICVPQNVYIHQSFSFLSYVIKTLAELRTCSTCEAVYVYMYIYELYWSGIIVLLHQYKATHCGESHSILRQVIEIYETM